MGLQVGVALWTMQSTSAVPAHHGRLYRQLSDDARRVEDLGFHSLWLAEHRAWYDGWCPAPVVAAAAAAAATTRLRFGTAMLLLPQADPARLAESVTALARLSGGRVDLGVGLGHRDAEFDALGIPRPARGRRMEQALDILRTAWSEAGARPHLWVGGMARPALRRAARRGLSYLLPQTLRVAEVREVVGLVREEAAAAGRPVGRIGMLKDAWITTGRTDLATESFLNRLRSHYAEESGAWWVLKGAYTGFERPDLLDRQLDRITATALVGTPDAVVERLRELADAGVDFVSLRFKFDVVAADEMHRCLALCAREVLPVV